MLKKLFVFILALFLGCYDLFAQSYVYGHIDSLAGIVRMENKFEQKRSLVTYIRTRFQDAPENTIPAARATILSALDKSSIPDKEIIKLFVEGNYQRRLLNFNAAEGYMLKGINLASKPPDAYMLFVLLNNLASIQTDKGNAIGAIYTYRLAQKQAQKFGDTRLLALLNLNISDLYYKNNLYSQSLFYLSQAVEIQVKNKLRNPRLLSLISYNKAENYFRMNNLDSLQIYHQQLLDTTKIPPYFRLFTYQNRTQYYIYLLKHDYKSAIKLIKTMLNDPRFNKLDLDKQHLADAYIMSGQPDSAKYIIDQLITKTSSTDHPEIEFQLYEMLGEIALKKSDQKAAAENFKLALKQSENRISNIIQVGDISAQIKIERIQSSYINTAEKYRKERFLLILIIVAATFLVAVITLLYRSNRQKRHYEKLLFNTKKKELAFINSHEVRKHLTNILGIIEIIRSSENRESEFVEVEEHLFTSAGKLDKAIKNISQKLSDDLL